MAQDSMLLHSMALADFFNGDECTKISIIREDGSKDGYPLSLFLFDGPKLSSDRDAAETVRGHPVSFFFRDDVEFLPLEEAALDLCRGHVLDIGAGVGAHSLALQNRGLEVCALDISPQACEIMSMRGVHDVRCTDIFNFDEKPFDTVLFLGNAIGVVKNLAGLDRFLRGVHKMVKPDGQILIQSIDLRRTPFNDEHRAGTAEQPGGYVGEVRMQFEYKGQKSPLWEWMHIDPQTLRFYCEPAGWSYRIVMEDESGYYLAQLQHSGAPNAETDPAVPE